MNADRNLRKTGVDQNADENQEQQADEEDEYLYEDMKRIMKELLFNGASRGIRAKFELPNHDEETGYANRLSTAP
jgi:hypothetical protein